MEDEQPAYSTLVPELHGSFCQTHDSSHPCCSKQSNAQHLPSAHQQTTHRYEMSASITNLPNGSCSGPIHNLLQQNNTAIPT
jgi:hypothetical protein